MYSVVEPLLRTASRFDANLSGISVNGDSSREHPFSARDHHEEKETSLDRLFSNVNNHYPYRNGLKPALNGGTKTATLEPTAEISITGPATTTGGSVLSSLPKRTMVHPARRVLEERELGGGVFR